MEGVIVGLPQGVVAGGDVHDQERAIELALDLLADVPLVDLTLAPDDLFRGVPAIPELAAESRKLTAPKHSSKRPMLVADRSYILPPP